MKAMKRKRTSVSDLNIDVLQHIIVFLAKSGDGYANFARATSVCKEFMELAGEKDLLKAVYFEDSCIYHPDASFWNINGLLSKCARAGSESACHVLLRHVKEQLATSRMKLTALDLSVKDLHDKTRAVKDVCTRARSKAAAMAWEDVACMINDIQMDYCMISQHIDAMDVGTLEWARWR